MKALIIDGEELLRLSLKEVVCAAGKFTDVIEAGSEHDFLSKTADHSDISLILLHPESLKNQGEEWIKLVRRLYPGVAIIVISSSPQAIQNRWMGINVLARSASVSDCIKTVRQALKLPQSTTQPMQNSAGSAHIRSAIDNEFSRFQQSIDSANPHIDLTRLSYRQKQILAMAADGLPNKEIAARLSIAEGTVKAHMHAIFKVLGVSNRTQAVIRYGASGSQIISDPAISSRTPETARAYGL